MPCKWRPEVQSHGALLLPAGPAAEKKAARVEVRRPGKLVEATGFSLSFQVGIDHTRSSRQHVAWLSGDGPFLLGSMEKSFTPVRTRLRGVSPYTRHRESDCVENARASPAPWRQAPLPDFLVMFPEWRATGRANISLPMNAIHTLATALSTKVMCGVQSSQRPDLTPGYPRSPANQRLFKQNP